MKLLRFRDFTKQVSAMFFSLFVEIVRPPSPPRDTLAIFGVQLQRYRRQVMDQIH